MPTSPDVADKLSTSATLMGDPVLALIAEEKRLEVLAIAADARTWKSSPHPPKTSSGRHSLPPLEHSSIAAIPRAGKIRNELKAGNARWNEIREASGCEAHYRGAKGLNEQASAILDQIRQTKSVTLGSAIAMLEQELCRRADRPNARGAA